MHSCLNSAWQLTFLVWIWNQLNNIFCKIVLEYTLICSKLISFRQRKTKFEPCWPCCYATVCFVAFRGDFLKLIWCQNVTKLFCCPALEFFFCCLPLWKTVGQYNYLVTVGLWLNGHESAGFLSKSADFSDVEMSQMNSDQTTELVYWGYLEKKLHNATN